MDTSSAAGAQAITEQRLAALEFVVENILPMLIQGSEYFRDIHQTLDEWADDSPPEMAENMAFPLMLEELLNSLPKP